MVACLVFKDQKHPLVALKHNSTAFEDITNNKVDDSDRLDTHTSYSVGLKWGVEIGQNLMNFVIFLHAQRTNGREEGANEW